MNENERYCPYCSGWGCQTCSYTGLRTFYKSQNPYCQYCLDSGYVGDNICPYCAKKEYFVNPVVYDIPIVNYKPSKKINSDNFVTEFLSTWGVSFPSGFEPKFDNSSISSMTPNEQELEELNRLDGEIAISRPLIYFENELALQIPEYKLRGNCSYCSATLSLAEFKIYLTDKTSNRVSSFWMCDGCFRKFSSGILRVSTNEKFRDFKINDMGVKDNKLVMTSWANKARGLCSYCPKEIGVDDFKFILNIGREWKNDISYDRWLCGGCFRKFQKYVIEMYYENILGLSMSKPPDKKLIVEEFIIEKPKEIPNFSAEEISKFREENFEVSLLLNDDECRIKMSEK